MRQDFAGNNPEDSGIWRRLLRVPLERGRTKEVRDASIKAELVDATRSGAAVLAWAVEGLRRYQQGGFQIPPIVLERTEELRQEFGTTTLAQRRAEIELTRLALERESSVLRGWLEQWADNIEEMQAMDFEGRKLRLTQMGIEATVVPTSAGEDRVQVVLNVPFDASLLKRDPERPSFNWTAQDNDDYERFIRLYSVPESPDPTPTPDTQLRSSGGDSSHSAPRTGTPRWQLTWTSDEEAAVW